MLEPPQEALSIPPEPITIEEVKSPLRGCDAVRSEASKYNWDVNLVVAIAKAESGCDTNAVGDDYVIAGLHAASCGVMQIRTLQGRPSCDKLKDLATNIEWAYKISNSGTNFKPWSVYTSGKYLNHL